MSTIANAGDMVPSMTIREMAPHGGGPGPESGGGLGAAEVIRIVKQRKLMIAVVWTLVYGMVIAGTFAVSKWAPQWTAETVMELDPPRWGSDEAYTIDPRPVEPETMKLQLETESRKLKSSDVYREVLQLPVVRETRWVRSYQDKTGKPDIGKLLQDFDDALSSTPIPDTTLFKVRFSAPSADEARTILNELCKKYHSMYREAATSYYSQQKDGLSNQLVELTKRRTDLQATITKKRAMVDVPQLESQRGVIVEHISNIMDEVTMYEAHTAQLEGQMDSIRMAGEALLMTPEIKIIVESDPMLRLYRQQAEGLDVEIQVAKQVLLGENHRNLKEMVARREHLLDLEANRREELINDLRARERENLEQSLASSKQVMLKLYDSLEESKAKQRDLDQNYQEFVQLIEDEKRLQEQIGKVNDALDVAEHALKDRSRIRLHFPRDAELPRTPSRPNWLVYLGGGFFFAAFVAFGLAFLREFSDTAVRTPLDVSRHGSVSVLGCIPTLTDEESDIEQIELASRNAPQSLIAESFRQVRTNLLFSGPPEVQRSVLITSPNPGDGKTSVAINMAVSLARSNQRVLLIDANFRKPALRNTFPNARPEGLSNILVGQSSLPEVVNKTDMPNLDVLSTGPMPPTPAELLGTRYMRELLSDALTRYDRVIIDGPPILLMSDALVLATQVDGVILVSRAVTNTKGTLKRAREQLTKINARVLGAVLNSVEARPGGYFRKQYRDFYDYAAEETPARELPEPESKSEETTPSA